MGKAELTQRLSEVHRETLAMVQTFGKEDFERKAPAAEWSAIDLFAHLADWNREAAAAIGHGAGARLPDLGGCREVPASGKSGLARVMESLRSSLEAVLKAYVKAPSGTGAEAVSNVIRHYQTHQNDLKVLVGSLRPH